MEGLAVPTALQRDLGRRGRGAAFRPRGISQRRDPHNRLSGRQVTIKLGSVEFSF